MRETRHLAADTAGITIETRADGEKAIVGYASVFHDGTSRTEFELWPGMVERIMPGAFDRALRERDDVRGLFNHDGNQVLGRTKSGTLKLSTDSRGLRYEITPPDTQAGRDLLTLIQRGDVNGSSFSFQVPPEGSNVIAEKRDGVTVKVRQITSVAPLYDVGPVTFPAYEATAASVRSLRDEVEKIRDHEADQADLDYRIRRLRNATVVGSFNRRNSKKDRHAS